MDYENPLDEKPAYRRTSIDNVPIDMMPMVLSKGRRTGLDRRTDFARKTSVGEDNSLAVIGEEGEATGYVTIKDAKAAMGMEVKLITSLLMFVNAIIGFPSELKVRAIIRSGRVLVRSSLGHGPVGKTPGPASPSGCDVP